MPQQRRSPPSTSSPPLFLVESESTELQLETENECQPFFVDLDKLSVSQVEHLIEVGLLLEGDAKRDVCVLYNKHANYLSQPFLMTLKPSFVSLDASRPWMIYWCLHGLDLLGSELDELSLCGVVHTLRACFTPSGDSSGGGGFGGGPGQMPHLATTYAAVLSLCIVSTHNIRDKSSKLAYTLLQDVRPLLSVWFQTLQSSTDSGAIHMHHDGEVDVRASYCMIVCAKLLQLDNTVLASHMDAIAEFIVNCQTFEGGFGGEPFCEAHGGYTYCSVAALQLLHKLHLCDQAALKHWLCNRQMSYEGGFQGRTNKLVDGCYSFWQGSALAIVSKNGKHDSVDDPWLQSSESSASTDENPSAGSLSLYDEAMLQRYILLCAQDVQGGLRDKPSKPRDFYHSCYNLSGLSISQHYRSSCPELLYGHPVQSRVAKTHPCFNLRVERVQTILAYDFDNANNVE
jgi:protein farnesyltransferase subunit beta